MKKTYKLFALLAMLSAGPTIAQSLNHPIIILPKPNAINVAVNSAFIWSKVPSATSYQFKLFKADSTLVLDTLVTDTIFSPQTLLGNMNYTWSIRAKSSIDSSVYFLSTFSTKTENVPNTPSAISPIGAISVVNGGATTSTVAFNWSASASASKYHFQVSYDSLFHSLIINDSAYSDNYYKNTFTLFNYNKQYYWRVAATNTTGTSNFTKAIAFNIPVESTVPTAVEFASPSNGQNNIPIHTSIFWHLSKLATSYRFELRDTLGNIVLQDDSLGTKTDTMMMVNSLKYGTYYIATVYARNQYGLSEPSFVRFTTESITAAPAKPVFSTKGSTGDAVDYNYSTDALTKKVIVLWSDKKSFDSNVSVDSLSFPSTTNSRYSASSLNKWYYVKIVAKNSFGFSTPLVDSVYNTMPAPNNVYISSPTDTTSKLTPVIKWTTSKWASSYRVSISTFEKNDTVYRSLHTDTTFVLPAGYLQAGKVYDLYVEAINSVGSSVTHRMIKTTNIPTPPAPVTKKDTIYMQDGPFPTLTWPAISGATSYCVQIAKDSNFTQLTANDCNITSSSYVIKPNSLILGRMEATNDRFFWRVAATNASGQGVWSTPSTFAVVIITANEENTIHQTVSVFPNPVINMLTIDAEVVSVNVKNTSGTVVLQSNINNLDMSNLSTGIYFVEFKTKAGATQKVKVIKSE